MSIDLSEIINLEMKPLYESEHLWAEESGATNANSAEWSFGNGATGYMGLRWDDTTDWEIVGMSFSADTYPATATITVDLMNYAGAASAAAANTLSSISLANAQDGGGNTNNAHKWETIDPPVPVPAGSLLGFITRQETGAISDARVLVRLRRKVGEALVKVS